jgi:hypothetical protein
MDFKAVEGSYVLKQNKVRKVPATDGEALTTDLVGFFEKRRLHSFFAYAAFIAAHPLSDMLCSFAISRWPGQHHSARPMPHVQSVLSTGACHPAMLLVELQRQEKCLDSHLSLAPLQAHRSWRHPGLERKIMRVYASTRARDTRPDILLPAAINPHTQAQDHVKPAQTFCCQQR